MSLASDVSRRRVQLARSRPKDLPLYPGLSEEQLVSFLSNRADLIEIWLAWSEDKRCSGGWFFQRHGSQFELGQVWGDGKLAPSEFFQEPAPACARFILRELAA